MVVRERAWVKMFREEAWHSQDRRCAYCLEPVAMSEITGDHVKSRRPGGATHRKNIKAACRPCNQLKKSMGESEFKNIIRTPPVGASFDLLMAHMRFRIWRRTWLACRRINRAVGVTV